MEYLREVLASILLLFCSFGLASIILFVAIFVRLCCHRNDRHRRRLLRLEDMNSMNEVREEIRRKTAGQNSEESSWLNRRKKNLKWLLSFHPRFRRGHSGLTRATTGSSPPIYRPVRPVLLVSWQQLPHRQRRRHFSSAGFRGDSNGKGKTCLSFGRDLGRRQLVNPRTSPHLQCSLEVRGQEMRRELCLDRCNPIGNRGNTPDSCRLAGDCGAPQTSLSTIVSIDEEAELGDCFPVEGTSYKRLRSTSETSDAGLASPPQKSFSQGLGSESLAWKPGEVELRVIQDWTTIDPIKGTNESPNDVFLGSKSDPNSVVGDGKSFGAFGALHRRSSLDGFDEKSDGIPTSTTATVEESTELSNADNWTLKSHPYWPQLSPEPGPSRGATLTNINRDQGKGHGTGQPPLDPDVSRGSPTSRSWTDENSRVAETDSEPLLIPSRSAPTARLRSPSYEQMNSRSADLCSPVGDDSNFKFSSTDHFCDIYEALDKIQSRNSSNEKRDIKEDIGVPSVFPSASRDEGPDVPWSKRFWRLWEGETGLPRNSGEGADSDERRVFLSTTRESPCNKTDNDLHDNDCHCERLDDARCLRFEEFSTVAFSLDDDYNNNNNNNNCGNNDCNYSFNDILKNNNDNNNNDSKLADESVDLSSIVGQNVSNSIIGDNINASFSESVAGTRAVVAKSALESNSAIDRLGESRANADNDVADSNVGNNNPEDVPSAMSVGNFAANHPVFMEKLMTLTAKKLVEFSFTTHRDAQQVIRLPGDRVLHLTSQNHECLPQIRQSLVKSKNISNDNTMSCNSNNNTMSCNNDNNENGYNRSIDINHYPVGSTITPAIHASSATNPGDATSMHGRRR